MISLRYQAGSLVLPRALPRALRDELWSKTFPLLAPDSRIEDPEVRSAALDALAQQQLRLENLAVPGTPMFFKHEERPLFVRPGKMRVNPPRPDELNRGRQKINLSFTLPPGAYATLVVRRALWFAADKAAQPETKAAPLPRGQKWGQPKPGSEEQKPKTPKKGFLERQRERKTARAERRAQHPPKGRRR
jgi:tRNA pseudouridine13 synthase